MQRRRFRKFLYALAAVLFMAGCAAACTYLFLAAYDLGVRSAGAARNAQAAPSPASSARSSSAPAASSKVQKTAAASAQNRELVLVNPYNRLPVWYRPNLVTELGFQMDSSVVKPFESMKAAARKDGVSLWISSAYRSTERQGELFQEEIENYSKTCPTYAEALASAEKSVAKPGYSEHATGLALDLNGVKDGFDQTDAFRWLTRNAQDYGFILRYPKDKQSITKIKYEPWHYRYVGAENAKAMKQSGLCLEEYLSRPQKTGD
ncbi:MAG: M15 family metallopeptidase [Oscillospiraceae bacterium]|nr:M15 family metallopeptidase [Oscillospiraceae bacterium]MCI1990197.1 M15 family metallopeptidase [Oscillospiraceae bacterium]MCI2035132.1 M15 family metallopeptidase [Oscillospiraceae bacterium]